MNRLILNGILWCFVIAIGRAQEPAEPIEASQTPTLEIEQPSSLPASEPTPVNGQPSPFRPTKSEPPRRVAEPKRIVIQPGVDAQESEVAMQFMADLEKAGIAKIDKTEMTPTSESPIVVQVFMREDESFEKIKLFLVDLRASGFEKLVLEFGGLHPEGAADKQHNGLGFRATKGYSQDELQRLEKVVQSAAERCGLSLYFPGTHVLPSGPKFVGPPDKVAVPSYARSFRPAVPQLRTDYEAANKQAYDLAESLRQTPDAAKKVELRTAVQRAFTLRQSLLRAELQEMQARLEKTQQSLDMRDRIADQIVDRRVEDLLNPQLEWNNKVSSETTGETAGSATSTANASPKLETTAPVTELEGDWHWVSGTDSLGKAIEVSPYNVSFKSDICTIAFQGGQFDRRVRVDPDSTRIFGFLDNRAFFADNYRIEGDQLTLYGDGVTMVYQRGRIELPKSIPDATEQQRSCWRSGIVEILTQQSADTSQKPKRSGYGVIVSSQTLIVGQIRPLEGDCLFFAKFDDGHMAPIRILEQGPQGFFTFEPAQKMEAKVYFRFSNETVKQHDEVHLWAQPAVFSELQPLELFKTTVSTLDHNSFAFGLMVWRLNLNIELDGSLPALDSSGDLLAITVADTSRLAVPVSQLKTMFPKSFGAAAQVSE